MRIPRLQFRLWWMMVLVFVAGETMEVGVSLRERQRRFKQISEHHFQAEDFYPVDIGSSIYHEDATCVEFQEYGYPPTETGKHFHSFSGLKTYHDIQWRIYHDRMGVKYRIAASSPWRPVSVDPDPPAGSDVPDHSLRLKARAR